MCTVSWLYEDGGYQLLCNRDERHARKAALPPRVRQRRGVLSIAPVDGDHGGSWIGVNQFGLSLCLLNRYQGEAEAAKEYTSRGRLLIELLDSSSRAQAQERIRRIGLKSFRPFTLLALEPGKPCLLVQWTGRDYLVEGDGERIALLVSSSYDPEGVTLSRRQLFDRLVAAAANKIDGRSLYSFHASHVPAASAYSTCMHREDARTVSFSWIKVAPAGVEFLYHPDSPCTAAPTGPAGHRLEVNCNSGNRPARRAGGL